MRARSMLAMHALLLGACELSVDVGEGRTGTDASACVATLTATDVSVGEVHACAVDLGGRAVCWGYGGAGQLGTGDTLDRSRAAVVLTNDRFTDVEVGAATSCARRTDGALLCWGSNFTGLLADGTSQASTTPVATLPSVSEFALYDGGLFARVGNAVWVWGENAYGQLGLGTTAVGTTLRTETDAGFTATALAPGANHACVLDAVDHARCAGDNTLGQLGVAGAGSDVFAAVDDRFTFVAIDAGYDRTCAVSTAGTLHCWGNNRPTINPDAPEIAPIPMQVGTDSDFTTVSVGFDHVCALRSGGRLWCWGGGDHLALTVPGDSPVPVEARPGTAFESVSAGRNATCAIRADDHAVLCFGHGDVGQLGRGRLVDGRPDVVCAP